jgi:hypothetical protein
MNALLGKITAVSKRKTKAKSRPGAPERYTVKIKPACVVPERKPVPEWLKNRTLEIERGPVTREVTAKYGALIRCV